MKSAVMSVLLSIAIASNCPAAELKPHIGNQGLGASLIGVAFPESLARDLQSGFENRIVIRLSVLSSGKIIERRDATITVIYDLWEERFSVRKQVSDAAISEMTFKQAKEVLRYLDDIQLADLFQLGPLQKDPEIALQAEVSINPIEREKMERVRKWVATNGAPSGAVSTSSTGAPLTAKPNELFNAIFDQYVRGDDVVATWKTTMVSKSFKPQPVAEATTK